MGLENSADGATTWVHVDIREFHKYKDNNFLIKKEKDLISQSMISFAKSLTLNFICTCNVSNDKTLKGKEKNDNHLFTVDDAIEGLKVINKRYGKDMAMTIESIYRWEGDHFKSGQYRHTGTPGMHAFNEIGPSYGWDTSLYDKYPEYTPIGIWYSEENEGHPGGNKKQEGILMYIKFPSVEAGMMYIAAFIMRNDGNVGRWHNKQNRSEQENYVKLIKTAIPRISRNF